MIYRSATSNRSYTFEEVKNLSTAFAGGLVSQWEWRKGDVFLFYTQNDIDVPPVMLGVLLAGGIVSPANPAYSVKELTFQLKNSNAKAIITAQPFLSQAIIAAEKSGIPRDRILLLGEGSDESYGGKHWNDIQDSSGWFSHRRPQLEPDTDLAFLVYSSGTTGFPKGVMLSHRNLVAQLLMIRESSGKWYSSGSDKVLGLLPFFHIYGLTALVLQSLHRGIEQVVMSAFDLRLFCELIQKHRIAFTYVAPPVMVKLARDKEVEKFDLSSLRMITCGAAPLSKELVDLVYKRLGLKANQVYGLSETSPLSHTQVRAPVILISAFSISWFIASSSIHRRSVDDLPEETFDFHRLIFPTLFLQPWDEWYTTVGSVGKLLPNMKAKCMDTSDPPKEVPFDTPGELWLHGPNVFKGYWHNPTATADCVTPDGYFKTGDIGYVSSGGEDFYITDRVKELIKYKGFQVAPAEIEGTLLDHPNVMDVAVIGINDAAEHTEVPRAYIVVKDMGKGPEEVAKEIHDWLADRVAYHKKLRGGIKFVQEIPKSATGKILRRVLKDQAKMEEKKTGAKL